MSFSMSCSEYNPPFPVPVTQGDDEETEWNQKNPHQRLLTLVRLGERNEPTYEANMEELVELFNSLIASYSRRGLLQGNVSKATRILQSSTQGKKTGHGDKKNSNKKNNDLQIKCADDGEGNPEAVLSEGLLFTALARILTDSKDTERRITIDSDSALLIALAAELCVAMSHHVQTKRDDGDACSLAEYELLAQSGKSILSGLVAKVRFLEHDMRQHSSQMGGLTAARLEKCLSMIHYFEEDLHLAPVLSCLRAACSFVTMFGTKLSRSTVLLADLKSIAWHFISFPEQSIQDAAARLLAALTLVGGTDRKTPSELWNAGLTNLVAMLTRLVDVVAPVTKVSNNQEVSLSEDAEVVMQRWIAFLRHDISSDRDRVNTLRCVLRGLTISCQHFLYRDCCGHTTGDFLEACIDIASLLELVERFLSYPMSAESLFYRTKKRVRDEAVQGGLISARTIATEIANEVKRFGHDILDCLVSSVGGPALLPFARRIIRVSYASLLTSCSGPVRKVMDPASSVQLEGKKRRWLHLSIALRARAVGTVHLVTVAFGSDRTAKQLSSDHDVDSKSDGEMAITLVAGCLMEQLGAKDLDQSLEDTWGTLGERVDLINSCLDCLRGAVSSTSGYLGFSTRSVIDSLVLTCLLRPLRSSPGNAFSRSSVLCRMFQLASTCVATPWSDGSSTSIVSTVKRVAMKACLEFDEGVSLAANDALRVCDLYGVPRAPPLVFVHRTLGDSSMRMEETAPKIIEDIQNATIEGKQARQAAELKIQEKRQLEMERKEINKRKREASEKTKNDKKKVMLPHSQMNVDDPTEQEMTNLDSGKTPSSTQELAGTNSDVEATESATKGTQYQHMKKTISPPSKVENTATHKMGHDVKDDVEDDDDFPDIDIVADGPDSDDD